VETYLNSSGLSRFHLKKRYIPLSIREQLKLQELKKMEEALATHYSIFLKTNSFID
jgi:hypothetical protein